MQIIHFPHPTLRHKSKPLRRVDAGLKRIIREMFELMYAAKGIGLAANQVDLPYRLFITNLESDPAAQDLERVFINPVLSRPKGLAEDEEGCLSLPGLYAQVKRPERILIQAYGPGGEEIHEELEELEARVVQHETDHLDGVLFIDRLSDTAQAALREPLDDFATLFDAARRRGEIPSDEEIHGRIAALEQERC